jgi:hypothetical protein
MAEGVACRPILRASTPSERFAMLTPLLAALGSFGPSFVLRQWTESRQDGAYGRMPPRSSVIRSFPVDGAHPEPGAAPVPR